MDGRQSIDFKSIPLKRFMNWILLDLSTIQQHKVEFNVVYLSEPKLHQKFKIDFQVSMSMNPKSNWIPRFRLASNLGYVGLYLGVDELGDDLFLNSFIGGAVETIAYALCFVTMKTGRKWLYVALQIIGGLSLIISGFVISYAAGMWTMFFPFFCLHYPICIHP